MSREVRIRRVELLSARTGAVALKRFYLETLGFPAATSAGSGFGVAVGSDELWFAEAPGSSEPFYHFAFLLPGDRFAEGRDWLRSATPLLARAGSDETTLAFPDWNAHACYVLDPAGNILELIAHHGHAENAATGPFSASEVVGISEIGLVAGRLPDAATALAAAGLRLWAGDVHGPEALGFVGAQTYTLILSARGRGWLPTGRAAESHPVTATLDTTTGATVRVSVDDQGEVVVAG